MTIDIAYFETALNTNDEKPVFESRDLQVFADENGKPVKKGRAAIIAVDAVDEQDTFTHTNGDIGVLVTDEMGRTGFLNIFHTTPDAVRNDVLKALEAGSTVPAIVYKEGKARLPEAKDFR